MTFSRLESRMRWLALPLSLGVFGLAQAADLDLDALFEEVERLQGMDPAWSTAWYLEHEDAVIAAGKLADGTTLSADDEQALAEAKADFDTVTLHYPIGKPLSDASDSGVAVEDLQALQDFLERHRGERGLVAVRARHSADFPSDQDDDLRELRELDAVRTTVEMMTTLGWHDAVGDPADRVCTAEPSADGALDPNQAGANYIPRHIVLDDYAPRRRGREIQKRAVINQSVTLIWLEADEQVFVETCSGHAEDRARERLQALRRQVGERYGATDVELAGVELYQAVRGAREHADPVVASAAEYCSETFSLSSTQRFHGPGDRGEIGDVLGQSDGLVQSSLESGLVYSSDPGAGLTSTQRPVELGRFLSLSQMLRPGFWSEPWLEARRAGKKVRGSKRWMYVERRHVEAEEALAFTRRREVEDFLLKLRHALGTPAFGRSEANGGVQARGREVADVLVVETDRVERLCRVDFPKRYDPGELDGMMVTPGGGEVYLRSTFLVDGLETPRFVKVDARVDCVAIGDDGIGVDGVRHVQVMGGRLVATERTLQELEQPLLRRDERLVGYLGGRGYDVVQLRKVLSGASSSVMRCMGRLIDEEYTWDLEEEGALRQRKSAEAVPDIAPFELSMDVDELPEDHDWDDPDELMWPVP